MLEPWDELLNLRLEHESCVAELETIKTTCARNHGKQHVAHCTECWNLYLNRMRDRYLHSGRMEWFTGRRQFLQELDMMFSKARGRALDFETIERRIYHEKELWYHDRVKNIGLPTAAAALSPSKTRLLQQKLNDSADLPVDDHTRSVAQSTQLGDWFSGNNHMLGLLEEDLQGPNAFGFLS